jgi:hypothetical protein
MEVALLAQKHLKSKKTQETKVKTYVTIVNN